MRELSELITKAGRQLPHTAISDIENGSRRVDVDDLTALAAALNVSPSMLLMPHLENEMDTETTVTATGLGDVYAKDLWQWISAGAAPTSIVGSSDAYLTYLSGLPGWMLHEVRDTAPPRANVMVERGGKVTWHGAGDAKAQAEAVARREKPTSGDR